MLPYDPGYSTMGSRAMLPLVALDLGFDWEANKVLLRLPQSVSVRDNELRARMDRQSNALMKVGLAISRLGDETQFPLEQQVDSFRKNMASIIDRGLSNPPKAKPKLSR